VLLTYVRHSGIACLDEGLLGYNFSFSNSGRNHDGDNNTTWNHARSGYSDVAVGQVTDGVKGLGISRGSAGGIAPRR